MPADAAARGLGGELADKVVLIDEAFADAHIPHAFGGAVTLAHNGEPRTTIDVGVNVSPDADRFEEVKWGLSRIGIDRFPGKASIHRDGHGRAFWGSNPVALFFAYDPIHEAMRRDAKDATFGDRSIPALSAEHLIVAKMTCELPRDWIDLEQVLTANPSLDENEIDRWLGHVVGTADARYGRFRNLLARLLGRDRPGRSLKHGRVAELGRRCIVVCIVQKMVFSRW